MSRRLQIPTAEVFEPLLVPSRYKGAYGGRGSGKSHFFGGSMAEDALRYPGERGEGLRAVCIREVQKTLQQSAKRLIEDKLAEFGLGESQGFKAFHDCIKTPGDGIILFQGMQDHTAESIKSLEGFHRAWVEEAQTLSANSLKLLRPTIRGEGSELWFSWNPRRKNDPVDVMFRQQTPPTGSVCVRANWSDNPWFPKVLEQERLDCLNNDPDQYEHIWEGDYISVAEGAYYARHLAQARREGRIGRVSPDPLMSFRLFCDIGGTGARADAFAIWVAQFVGAQIRVLNYYETVGQPLSAHVAWMRENGYLPQNTTIWLPHDGRTNDRVYDVSYESALREAGYEVEVVPNQGRGAAAARIERARRLFPQMYFDAESCAAGLEALGWYHEKIDETRNVGLGPEHDWASHGCFHGRTKVLTRYGMCRIMDLPENGEVLTPCGWKQYILPRITKRNAQLVEVRFTDGYSVKCTPDHLFLTGSGWRSAESLTPNTAIRSTLTKSRSISMAASTVYGRAKTTFREVAAGCIGMLGSLHLVQSPVDVTYTTRMATSSITGSKIWNACQRASTYQYLAANEKNPRADGSLMTQDRKPPIGMPLQKVGSGTSARPNDPKVGRSGRGKKSLASIAASYTWRWFAKAAIPASIARSLARWLHIESAGKRTSMHVVIESVRKLSETDDVWDITVPDGHWFSLANGAVVHNSDAFGLMAVAHEVPEFDEDWDEDDIQESGRSAVGGY